jgi:SNF2 family DNA or RNA helicase
VLSDLPPKTEIDRVCVLGLRQKRLYDALAHALRESVKKDLRKRGDARTRLSVLTAILRLRQMACDPRLVDPTIEATASAKRDAFLDVVRELVSEGRRALVFSQFASLLALWREDLDREGIGYAYLDGHTRDRDSVVARFREGDLPLFLISLKAGGVGMNLTEADTVVFCDPWWNPAVEAQAEDRAHRPGQTKPVTVVRLVAEGTIEQKVALLKEHKRALADAVLERGSDAEVPVDEDELALLFDGFDDAEADDVATDRVVPTRTLDALRAMVRYLEDTGFERRALARAVRVPAAQLALLQAGHRIGITERAAARIEELHAKRRGAPRTI